MPHKPDDDELVNLALMALEDEMKSWRHVVERDGHVRLIRHPSIGVGFAAIDVPVQEQTVEMQYVKKEEVWPFLRWRGMQAAVQAIKEAQAA